MSDITVERFVTSEQLREDVNFTEAEIDQAMLEQASLMAYYGDLESRAQYQVDRFKQLLEVREAQKAKQIRDEAAQEGRKITEKLLEQEVAMSPVVIKHRKALNEAKQVYEMMRIALDALRQKKDMVIQFGVRHRMEMEQQGRILGRGGDEGKRRVAEVTGSLGKATQDVGDG